MSRVHGLLVETFAFIKDVVADSLFQVIILSWLVAVLALLVAGVIK